MLCPPSMNLICECLIYRTPALQVFAVIGILVAFMQGGEVGGEGVGEMVVSGGGQEQEDMLGSTSTDPQLSLAPD